MQNKWSGMENTLTQHGEAIDQLQSGVAMSLALSGIQHPAESQSAIGLGVGHFAGKSALGLQASYQMEDSGLLSFGVGATKDDVAARGSISFSLDDLFQ
jgi:hypothetical protein